MNKTSHNKLVLSWIHFFGKLILGLAILLSTVVVVGDHIRMKLSDQLRTLENQLAREEEGINSIYQGIKNNLSQANVSYDEAKLLADKAVESIVCSEANRYNNQAHQVYTIYSTYLVEAKKESEEYTKRYKKCGEILNKINDLEEELNFKEENFSTLSVNSDRFILNKIDQVVKKEDGLVQLLSKSQDYADKLYKEYYPYMLPITTGEGGDKYYSDEDQFCIMNVIENRIKSPYYPNTVKEVIFQPGQYQPTWDGSWDKTPDERTKKNVENYLRGRVETGMPSNVLYQAMFIQGDGVWKHISNSVDVGHFYCYKK